MKNRIIWLVLATLVIAGAGCSWFSQKIVPSLNSVAPAGPKQADFQGVDPAAAALRVNFVPGSQIEIRQTYMGQDAEAAEAAAGDDKAGVRIVTIERFAPMNYANVSWKLNSLLETEASRQAREQYEQQAQASSSSGMADAPPVAKTEMQAVAGALSEIELKNAHELYPPAYWPSDKVTANGTSGLWLSKDVLDELTKNQHATIYYGLGDERLYAALQASPAFSAAIHGLLAEVNEMSKQGDPDWAEAEASPADWTLKINGQDVTVQVLKVHDWYGDIVVLDNPQNPLILKMTYSPRISGASDNLKNDTLLPSLFSYEVTDLVNVQ